MPKISDGRRLLRSTLGPVVLLICVAAFYAVLIYGFSLFEYNSEWKAEQKNFEKIAADVEFEKQRLQTSSASAQIYSSKYSLASSDVYGIISGFLNKTLLVEPAYTFMWSKCSTFIRMYQHALQLNDDHTLVFYKPSTKIIDTVFRSIFPISTTFAVGCSVSALHSIVTNILKICIRQKKYEAWTVGRNKMLRVNVIASLIVACAYFVLSFFLTTISASRWQDVSFTDGIKITLNLIATVPPSVQLKLITDAHTLTAFCFVIHTATAYVIFALIQFIKTWRISEFAIPLISDIDQADQVDKDMQVQYRSKNELFKNNQPMGEKAE
ncbi:Polycystin-Associated Channel-Like [Caenorhabditis elegans]|uniref:Polycystin-Associated Channel-Like n=1 Tax=Caenorhabditis elegans TaxID=6239 RepID=Q7YTK5_CAEEL|nr:Uncharacterized protein CELE_T13F3.7 [Caenorhabditis elegans]CAE17923.1 Uncharacterized protein CELE_T13F3.7 [Caenorhabditis elegans]|eukprot:NP_001024137.1 Uncharacterized protein CELE_T13F3.7 [Caenorhabditis elegans]